MANPFKAFAEGIAGKVTDLAGEFITDKDKLNEFKARLTEVVLQSATELFKAQRDVIVAEAQGDSWLQRNWRPLTMLNFTIIMFNNFIIAPYLQAWFGWSVVLTIPEQMWGLLTVGIGGYIASRTIEKTGSGIRIDMKGQK